MIRKIMLLLTWLGLWTISYSQNHASAELKSLVFSNPVDGTISLAPSIKTYLVMGVTPKLFVFGSCEYQKYSYLPIEYPTHRPNFLVGPGFKNKDFSARLGLGTGEKFDYLWEAIVRVGPNINQTNYTWFGEVVYRSGSNNTLKKSDSTNVEETVFGGSLTYRFSSLFEISAVYNGKKIQLNAFPYSHWWGLRNRMEVENGWYIFGEFQRWESKTFGLVGIQILIM